MKRIGSIAVALAFSCFSLQVFAQSITTGSVSGSPFCQSENLTVNYSISGSFNGGNTFYVELSDNTGSFSSPDTIGSTSSTSGGSITATIPSVIDPGSAYRIRVSGDSPAVTGSDNGSNLTINSSGLDPAEFGNNEWYVFGYNGKQFVTYLGSYIDTSLNILSSDYFPTNGSPSDASNYQGCSIPNDQHSFSYKREGFTAGQYTLDIRGDDDHRLYVNGVLEYSSSYTSTIQNAVWSGNLGANSKIEIQVEESGGESALEVEFNYTPTLVISDDLDVCTGATVKIGVDGGANYDWSGGNTTYMSAPYNTDSVELVIPSSAPTGVQTYTVTGTDVNGNGNYSASVDVSIVSTYDVSVSDTALGICSSNTANVTASGATNFLWIPSTGVQFNNSSGSNVTLSPSSSTVYKVTADGSCPSDTEYVNVTVFNSSNGTNPVYGQNQWILHGYDDETFSDYRGYYSFSSFNFDTRDDWSINNSPSDAANWQGCSIGNNNHSYRVRREGFPCSYYQIDIPNHDDGVTLYIDGVQVYSKNTWYSNNYTSDVWQGYLGPDSKVEVTIKEQSGGSHVGLTFIPLYGPEANNNHAIWEGTTSTSWNTSSNWCGTVPGNGDKAYLLDLGNNDPVVSTSVSIDTLYISSNVTFLIDGTGALTVSEPIENDGTIEVESSASLVQTHSGSDQNTGSGNYIVHKQGRVGTAGYNAYSSPVENADIATVFANTNPCDIFVFDASDQSWKYDYPNNYSTTCLGNNVTFTSSYLISGSDGDMDEGRGYFIPGGANTSQANRTFTGQVNNGDISYSIATQPNPGNVNWTQDNWNLIGNPYPSSINAAQFWNENAVLNSRIMSGIYYWDDDGTNTNSSSDYAAWNNSGATVGPNSNVTPNGHIASGQGFFVMANQNTSVEFNNSMRSSSNGQFFKNGQIQSSVNFPRLWISLKKDSTFKSQMLVAFPNEATEEKDRLYDALKMESDNPVSIAAIIDEDKFVIEGKAPMQFEGDSAISKLSIHALDSGKYNFEITDFENLFGIDVYLVDLENDSIHNLREHSYEFEVNDSLKTDDRFEVHYKLSEISDPSSVELIDEKNDIKVYAAPNNVIVEAMNTQIDQLQVYDISGREVVSRNGQNATRIKLNSSSWLNGVYIVSVVDDKGKRYRDKIVIQ
ncbi:T9SS type A sorting domain-containing protein [Salibacter halophilus]|uniref:T9SS type A sorting domain-containing protein n=1 Tax=Salibacter halophilus TaxID=1803916 RepID=A0A6N6M889_9FLAO|nr:T9SS type A sorting domain-containing protein [Salibacter halophilus]KAB1065065.1 T9SS type A sorting domain-containing protein [Salibacter halophilus]